MSDRRGVVVHLNEADPGAQAAVLRNVANLRQELGGDDPIEIVTHGGGVDLCTGRTGLGDQVAALQNRGVAVLACQNTMTSRGLTEPDLLAAVGVVTSGVAHLVRRQRDGWAYLRP